jgi:hypothetical protein
MRQIFLKEIFYTLTGALIILSALELIHPGVVLAYININWVLIFWLINVILITVTEKRQDKKYSGT